MKDKIEELLKEYTFYIQPEEGDVMKVIDSEDIKEIVDDIFKILVENIQL